MKRKDPVEEIREIRDKISAEIKDLSYKELKARYDKAGEKLCKEYGLVLPVRRKASLNRR